MAKLRSIFGFLLVAAVFFAAWRIVPVMYANFQFQQWLTDESRSATYRTMTDRELQTEIQAKADQLGITLPPDSLEVQKSPSNVNIKAEYEVTVDLLVYDLKIKFTPEAHNTRI
jgi:hypothetical protein